MKRSALIVVGSIALASMVAACGAGSSSSSAGAPKRTTASSTTGSGVDPNAAEVNPAGDIPDNQVFVAYTPPSGGFSVKVPEGWARTEAGGAVAFTDKLNSIRMESLRASSAPTVHAAEQNELPAIRTAAKNFEAGKVSSITRKAGPVVLLTYLADSAPDPVTGKVVHDAVERYEFWKSGTEVVLTLSGPQGADNVDPWRIVTDSFGWQA
ncbi:MAG: hypothetical protein QOD30_609 [Actinomycetota bacterium]|jgi:hypothetical protein|nr:hypothetical protein [Actinomycetota bacterium]